ncbi:MAG: lysoplasmalogenase family protein [Flavobacteriaceae bacterium]
MGLFVLSDTMIAFNSFYFDSEFFGGWVMATYLSAQALIISYFIGIKSIQ